MRSHLATLPLPPKKTPDQPQLGDLTHSDSSSTHSQEDKLPEYGLRANPKRSFKGSDPGLFLDAGSTVQEQEQELDRESETESTHNPTRRRSKRTIHKKEEQTQNSHDQIESKKSKHSESVTESAPVSSVSDASQDEEVALCLMMLSRDDRVWLRKEIREEKSVQGTNDSAELTTRVARRRCKTNRAPLGHGGHKEKESSKEYQEKKKNNNNGEKKKIYECPFCAKVFGSGQALGGHKRSHLLGSGSSTNNTNKVGDDDYSKPSFILDLNLPAPIDDDHDQDHSQIDFVLTT